MQEGASSLCFSNTTIHCTVDNNNDINNNSATEYRLTYKQKKNQTAACSYCKIKKVKCSGTLPCDNCVKKNVVCEYVEQKRRGKKKKELKLDAPLSETEKLRTAQSLWNQAERLGSVEKFCNLRWWWRSMLDLQGIKSTSSLAYHGQLCLINAWLARLNNNYTLADQLYEQGSMIAKHGLQDSGSTAATALYILLSDYAPSRQDFYDSIWAGAENIVPTNPSARRTRFYGLAMRAMYERGTNIDERCSLLLKVGAHAKDLWDAACFLSVKLCLHVRKLLHAVRKNRTTNITTLSSLLIRKSECESLLVDVLLCQNLFLSQAHLFGLEWTTCTQYTKTFLLWCSGEREKAVIEAAKLMEEASTTGINILCMEIKVLLLPLLILNEAGITKYNKASVNFIERICEATDQTLMLQVLAPMLEDLCNGYTSFAKNCDILTLILDIPHVSYAYPLYPSYDSSEVNVNNVNNMSVNENNDLSVYFTAIDSASFTGSLQLEEWNVQ